MPLVSESRLVQSALVTQAKPKRTVSVRATRIGWDLKDPITRARAIEEIAAALEESEGVIVGAAARLGVLRGQVNRWIDETPELAERVNAIRFKHGNPLGEDPEEES